MNLRITAGAEPVPGLVTLCFDARFDLPCALLVGLDSLDIRAANRALRVDAARGVAGVSADRTDLGDWCGIQRFWLQTHEHALQTRRRPALCGLVCDPRHTSAEPAFGKASNWRSPIPSDLGLFSTIITG